MAMAFASVFHDLMVNLLCAQNTLSDVALPGGSFTDVIQLLPKDIKTVIARAADENGLGQKQAANTSQPRSGSSVEGCYTWKITGVS